MMSSVLPSAMVRNRGLSGMLQCSDASDFASTALMPQAPLVTPRCDMNVHNSLQWLAQRMSNDSTGLISHCWWVFFSSPLSALLRLTK